MRGDIEPSDQRSEYTCLTLGRTDGPPAQCHIDGRSWPAVHQDVRLHMRRPWWRVYFYLMVVLALGAYAVSFFVLTDIDANVLRDVALLPLYLAQLVGLYGYVYVRRIGSHRIWQLVFVASIIEALWMAYDFTTVAAPPELGQSFVVSVAIGTTVLLLPLWFGLYAYAFRSSSLWANAT